MSQESGNAAEVFIDLENLHYSAHNRIPPLRLPLNEILQVLKSRFFIRRKRVYFDPSNFDFGDYRQVILDNAMEIVTCLETRSRDRAKNSVDIKMVIDILDAAVETSVWDFVIASGDGDFVPLVSKLTAIGKRPIILGFEETTSSILRSNSFEFISVNSLLEQSTGIETPKQAQAQMFDRAPDPKKLILEIFRSNRDQLSVGMPITAIRLAMKRLDPGFDERRHGFDKFTDFVKEFGDIVQVHPQPGFDSVVYWKEDAPYVDVEEDLEDRKARGHDVLKALLGTLNWNLNTRTHRLRVYDELYSVIIEGAVMPWEAKGILRERLFWDKSGLGSASIHLFDLAYRARAFINPLESTKLQEWIKCGADLTKHIELLVLCVTKALYPSEFRIDAGLEYLEIPNGEWPAFQEQIRYHNDFLAKIHIFGVRNMLDKWRI